MAIKDYLTQKTADYSGYLAVAPQDIINVIYGKAQEVYELDDEETLVITHSGASKIKCILKWNQYLTEAEAYHIIDLWNQTGKANGRARTFYWTHPIESNIYVTRFLTELSETYTNFFAINAITLKLEGYK